MNRLWIPLGALVLCSTGCGLAPEKVSLDDPRVKPLVAARDKVEWAAYGFTPITNDSKISLELASDRTYDAMLHIYGETSRTVAFKRDSGGYRWIGEQEIFPGVKEYDSVDGHFTEELVFTYEIASISGAPLGELSISYHGEDSRLAWPKKLSLDEAVSVLEEWKRHRAQQARPDNAG